MGPYVWDKRSTPRRMLKKARLLTRPTPARQDAPFREQGRRRVETGGVPSVGYVEDFDEPRTKLADFFSILPARG